MIVKCVMRQIVSQSHRVHQFTSVHQVLSRLDHGQYQTEWSELSRYQLAGWVIKGDLKIALFSKKSEVKFDVEKFKRNLGGLYI